MSPIPLLYYLAIGGCTVAAFTLVGEILFKGNTFYRAKRIYYLTAICGATLLPLLGSILPKFVSLVNHAEPIAMVTLGDMSSVAILDDIAIKRETIFDLAHLPQWLLWIWITGVCISLLRIVGAQITLKKRIGKSYRLPIPGTQVHILPEGDASFSFLGRMYLPAKLRSDQALKNILCHEAEHIRGLHFIDLLLTELSVIIGWWNPFVWILSHRIQDNLEYLADEAVLRHGSDAKSYQYQLLHMTIEVPAGPLCSNYSINNFKQRIKMMNKKKSQRRTLIRYTAALPMVALTLLAANALMPRAAAETTDPQGKGQSLASMATIGQSLPSNTSEAGASVTDTTWTSQDERVFEVVEKMPEFPGGTSALQRFLMETIRYPKEAMEEEITGRVIVQFIVDKDGSVINPKVIRNVHPVLDKEAVRIVTLMPKWKPGRNKGKNVATRFTIPIVFQFSNPEKTQQPKEGEIFTVVEEMPKFPGGQSALMTYLAQNIQYPEDAIKSNATGRVIVEFVICKDGSIRNVNVLRGVMPSIDAEAVRVVKSMPRWKPGKQKGKAVDCRFTIPISFSLQQGDTTPDTKQ